MSWDKPAFEIGEVVALRSSKGDSMTIESVDGEYIACVWKDRMGKVRRDRFHKLTLKQSCEADAHLIFMPLPMMNEAGVKQFMSGEYVPPQAE